MKWTIASAIHGSAHYCRLLLKCFEREGAERLLLLGDLLYHGPRNDLPKDYDTRETARLLNAYAGRIAAVRGNCDAEVDQMMLDFPILSDSAMLELDGRFVFASHGHVWSVHNPPKLAGGGIVLGGHTHVPECREAGGAVYLNPGSVSIPKEASPHSYISYTDGVFTWKDIEADSAYMHYPAKNERGEADDGNR